jgi:hypothetical protein
MAIKRLAITTGDLSETLLARSSPMRRLRTARTRTPAPRKSTRWRRALKEVMLSAEDGRLRKTPTARQARSVPGY